MGTKLSKSEIAKQKATAKLLLEASGQDYDEWLHEQHIKIEQENKAIMMLALEKYAENIAAKGKGNLNEKNDKPTN